ncbi:MAG: imidazole glycerol phosphate synthase subunit HisF [Candidatus Melainabacteria bacterium RIFCSPLOWO2_02_FULL_35_15]|nr:MAG: imidazole glycerol phosphate synthase subunit HisF [Candidatus Melainabacteria bacterium RIFCSPLOWO2_12_FULL_35_11]OGI13463.1 MAG: imidazole glycerol phosphate synthase subunit HisF [Candidatus Melainabacteria bacterium RIFCSPLOWO2_02_FULL_35_15]
MLAKRIIPCLDIKNGRVVKGTKFLNLKDAGDPVELAKYYNKEGADELCFLDITASHEERKIIIEIVEAVAREVFIPFTVGGGISSTGQMKDILRAGADKITISTSAVKNPNLIKEGAVLFGSQCIVLAIDAKKQRAEKWEVYVKGGRENTGLDAIEWVKKAVGLGAGEILLTSMDADGTKTGYDMELTKKIVEAVSVPVIASGGAGKIQDITDVFKKTNCSAALLASILHYKDVSIREIKEEMRKEELSVRI